MIMTDHDTSNVERLAAALPIFHQASRVHGQTVQAHNDLVGILKPLHYACLEQVLAEINPDTNKKLYTFDDPRSVLEVERRMAAEHGDRVVRLADLERRLQDTRAALEREREELATLRTLVEYDTVALGHRTAELLTQHVLVRQAHP
jgi:hypothetical protein